MSVLSLPVRSLAVSTAALLLWCVAVGGVGTAGPATAVRASVTPVAAAPSASIARTARPGAVTPPEQSTPSATGSCSSFADITGYTVVELFGVIPGLSLFFKVANALAKAARHGTCSVGGRSTSVVEFLVARMESVAGRIRDERHLESIYVRSRDLLQSLQREQSSLDRIGAMNAIERSAFSTVMQTIGNAASQLEAELSLLPWQALPAVAVISGIKNGAYALAYGLADPGERRRHLANEVIPAERAETLQLVRAWEADLVHYVRADLVTVRVSSTRTANGMVPATTFEIRAAARKGEEWVYSREWRCERRWRPRRQCRDFESRRSDLFAAALATHRDLRSKLLSTLGPDYLAIRNALAVHGAAEFVLANNRVGGNNGAPPGDGLCLDVLAATPDSDGGLHTMPCIPDPARPTDQVWRLLPSSGQLLNVSRARCLAVAGTADGQTDSAEVVLETCEDGIDTPRHANQQWGLHPLGYLVHRTTGTCLDVAGGAAPAPAAPVRVAPCRYDLDAGVVNAAGGLARGSSIGAEAGDQATNQTWTVWYRGEPLSAVLPAPPAKQAYEAPPLAVDDSATVPQGAGPAVIDVLGNDIDPDGGEMSVDGVTSPAHGQVEIVEESDGPALVYTPVAGLCDRQGRAPVDTFSYVLNGGSSAVVAVEVACLDTTPPNTEIITKANIFGQTRFSSHSGRLSFSASEPGVTFECRVGSAAYRACRSDEEFYLERGRHVFEVRAVDAYGNRDPSPARRVVVCAAVF